MLNKTFAEIVAIIVMTLQMIFIMVAISTGVFAIFALIAYIWRP